MTTYRVKIPVYFISCDSDDISCAFDGISCDPVLVSGKRKRDILSISAIAIRLSFINWVDERCCGDTNWNIVIILCN